MYSVTMLPATMASIWLVEQAIVDHRLDGERGRKDRFTQHDDREQTVALPDVLGVPGRHVPSLGEDGNQQFAADQKQRTSRD